MTLNYEISSDDAIQVAIDTLKEINSFWSKWTQTRSLVALSMIGSLIYVQIEPATGSVVGSVPSPIADSIVTYLLQLPFCSVLLYLVLKYFIATTRKSIIKKVEASVKESLSDDDLGERHLCNEDGELIFTATSYGHRFKNGYITAIKERGFSYVLFHKDKPLAVIPKRACSYSELCNLVFVQKRDNPAGSVIIDNGDLKVRRSVLEDLDDIIRLKRQPQITKYNFKLTDEAEKDLEKVLSAEQNENQPISEYYSIEFEGTFAGAISVGRATETSNSQVLERTVYYLGFDLLPEFQGKGIMYKALQALIKEILSKGLCGIMAECDGNNKRCKRLLQKLKFNQFRVGLFSRIKWVLKTKRFTWLARYATSNELWPLNNDTDTSDGEERQVTPPPLPKTKL